MQSGGGTHAPAHQQGHPHTKAGHAQGQTYAHASIRGPEEKGKANVNALADRLEPRQRVTTSRN